MTDSTVVAAAAAAAAAADDDIDDVVARDCDSAADDLRHWLTSHTSRL